MKPRVLVVTPITEQSRDHLDETYDLYVEEDPAARAEYIAAEGRNIKVIVTEGPR